MNDITAEPINISAVVDSVKTPGAGAIDVFIGTTRDHSNGRKVVSLEYEAYVPMALKNMTEIENQSRQRWNLHDINIVHRIGKVAVGEPSIVIAVSSAHRDEAFQACRFLIDQLKMVVPIWKREYFADGSVEWSLQTHAQAAANEKHEAHP
jgi:molybdopterin synthase catalytic subunit